MCTLETPEKNCATARVPHWPRLSHAERRCKYVPGRKILVRHKHAHGQALQYTIRVCTLYSPRCAGPANAPAVGQIFFVVYVNLYDRVTKQLCTFSRE